MYAIFKKELSSFFNSAIGYLVIGLFLGVMGLFLWVFEGAFNIPNTGFADLAPFFQLAPWFFIFLIPAITMRSFSEEKKAGTLELLLTRPITTTQLVLGKYLGALVVIIFTLILTLIYVSVLYKMGNPEGNLDVGVTVGSYIGLFFLGALFTAIGIFTSSLTTSQIFAFITAVFICFTLYIGFEGIASLGELSNLSRTLSEIGIKAHYDNISRGVIDTRDLIYFISFTGFFLFLTVYSIRSNRVALS